MQRIRKPKSHKGKKFLQDREPKIIENIKRSSFYRGKKTNEVIVGALRDLYHFKKPNAVMVGGKKDFLPFEDEARIESLSRKFDTSLFFFANHSKKRPNNLIIGRLFDHQMLDMVELGVEEYKGLSEFTCEKITTGLKPCLVFSGPAFEQNETLKKVQNLLVDAFHREEADAVRLQGLEHLLSFTAVDDKIMLRSYKIHLKKSGCPTPRVELTEIGPSIDFKIRRTKFASDDLFKSACKRPKELKPTKVKNVRMDVFGSKLGRLHVKQQSIKRLQTRKMKGLRKTPAERREMRQKRNAKPS